MDVEPEAVAAISVAIQQRWAHETGVTVALDAPVSPDITADVAATIAGYKLWLQEQGYVIVKPSVAPDEEVHAFQIDSKWTVYAEREHKDRPEWAYTEDGYCVACGNGKWKFHAPWCELSDLFDLKAGLLAALSKEPQADA